MLLMPLAEELTPHGESSSPFVGATPSDTVALPVIRAAATRARKGNDRFFMLVAIGPSWTHFGASRASFYSVVRGRSRLAVYHPKLRETFSFMNLSDRISQAIILAFCLWGLSLATARG